MWQHKPSSARWFPTVKDLKLGFARRPKTLFLREGETLKLGDVQGKVISIGSNFIELETEGKRWTVGMDEPLADAYKRGLED